MLRHQPSGSRGNDSSRCHCGGGTRQACGEVTQALHGTHEWEGQAVEISCLLSTHRSVLNVVHECEAGCTQLFQLEEAQQWVYHEQQRQQHQMEQFLQQFQNEVRKVEELQNANQTTTQTIMREVPNMTQEPRSIKPTHPSTLFWELILYPKMRHPVNNGYGSLKRPPKHIQQLL